MKKLILTLAMVMTVFIASASSVRYFTRPQATRVAAALDAQNELMIYCGYEYELATYVIINEVWAEPVNSKYYEIWLYGYDAYTGEEIYMPLDLSCIWLYNAYGNRMYSAAQYLRFRSTVATPNFYWTMPPYNPFVRHFHDPHFNHGYTYHWEIHRHGWRPPTPTHGNPWPYHPYYMRTPHTPAPVPTKPFTPGVNYPQTPDGHGYIGGNTRSNLGTRSTAFNNAGGTRSGSTMNNAGNPGTTNRSNVNTGNTNGRSNSSTNVGNTNGRSNTSTNTGSTGDRSSSTVNTGNNSGRSSNTLNTGNSSGRSSNVNNGGSSDRSSNTNTGNTSGRGNTSTVNTGSTSGRSSNVSTGTTSSRSSNVSTNTTNRNASSTKSTTQTSSSRGTTTNSGSNSSRSSSGSTSSTNGRNNGTTNSGSRSTR